MAWWRRRQETKQRETKSAVLGLSDDLGKFLIFGENHAATASSAFRLYEQSTAVSVPVNMVTDAFSVIDPVLLIGNDMIFDHPVLSLLRNPSPWYTLELFLETLSKNYLVAGESPVVALGNVGRPPLELQPLSPKSLTPVQQAGSDVAQRWTVSGNTLTGVYEADVPAAGKPARYLNGGLRELAVIRNFSTRDNSLLRGQSLLVPAAREARSQILGTEHNVQLLERGGRVSLVFHFDEDLSEDDFITAQDRVVAQYGGATRAGQIGVTSGGKLNIQELGIAPKDMDFANLQMIAQKSVALQFRVPLPLITDQRQTLNNYREGKLALYDDAIIPLSKRIFSGVSKFLLPRFGLDPTKARLAMNPDDVTALAQRRNDELEKRKRIGIETPDELRALMGREALAEGGDVVYQNASMVPLGTDLFTDDQRPGLQEDNALGSARADE